MVLGMISGLEEFFYGFMLEFIWWGIKFIVMFDGSECKFIYDGDIVMMCGYCEQDGLCIGFGEVVGKVFFV